MNLAIEPWIPVVQVDGRPATVSLREMFESGHQIQDLAVRPHERIALMRLLICIAQSALDGPEDYDDWKVCRERIAPAALDYLDRWQHAFELFGNGQRFLQVSKLKKPKNKSSGEEEEDGNSTSKLDLALATGNNTTLFDNAGGSNRIFTHAQLALMLLTFQCFSPGGTIGVALWNDVPTPGWSSYPVVKPGQSNHAPCLPGAMLHAFLRRENLTDTIHLNLVNKHMVELIFGRNRWGCPIWESMPDSPEEKSKIANATASHLGRLVPLSRTVRLETDCRSMLLANGLTYPAYPESRELSATVVIRRREGNPTRVTLGASLDRALWRELYSLTVKRAGSDVGGPIVLQNLADLPPEATFDLWVGALVTDKRKAAHILDAVEAVFHVPACLLEDQGQQIYEKGVQHAQSGESRLRRALAFYRLAIETNRGDMTSLAQGVAKQNRAERLRFTQMSGSAITYYWTDVERQISSLLGVSEHPALLGIPPSWHKTEWGQGVWRASCAAYRHACAHDTPRQIRAYALGLNTLFATPADQSENETEKEPEA
jgi:CRISPR system Cascade subunit CasA